MGKTSFKTHDPFVVMEHLDGKLPLHIASLILCSLHHLQSRKIDHTFTNYENTIIQLIFVHSICIVCQVWNRYQFTQEADVVQQQIAKHINKHDTQKAMQQTVYRQMLKFIQENATKITTKKLRKTITKAKNFITGNKEKQEIEHQKRLQIQTKNPIEDLSPAHFQLKSLLQIIGGALYQWQIFTLIVMLFYRKTMIQTDKLPAVIIDNREGQNQTTTEHQGQQIATQAGYYVLWEVALFLILITDYFCQMAAIMLIQLCNFVIDLGRPTSTDRISESKFVFKPVTFLMTSIVSNIVTTLVVYSQSQMRVLPVNKISFILDVLIMVSYGTMLAAAQHFNIMKKGPFTISVLIQKKRFQFIIYTILTLTMARCLILVFGTLIQMAYHDNVDNAKEALTSYTLNQFQALQMVFAIPYLLADFRVADVEAKLKQRIKLQQEPFYKKLEDPKKLKGMLKDIDDPESKNWQSEYKNLLPKRLKVVVNKSFHQNENYVKASLTDYEHAISKQKIEHPKNQALCEKYNKSTTHQLKSYFRIKFILSNLYNYKTLDQIKSIKRTRGRESEKHGQVFFEDSKEFYLEKDKTLDKHEIENKIIVPNRYKFATVINQSKSLNEKIKEQTKLKWQWPRLILIQNDDESITQTAFQSEVNKIVDQLYRKELSKDEDIKRAIEQVWTFLKFKQDRELDYQQTYDFLQLVLGRLGISEKIPQKDLRKKFNPESQTEITKNQEDMCELIKYIYEKMDVDEIKYNKEIVQIFYRDHTNQTQYPCLELASIGMKCTAKIPDHQKFGYMLSKYLNENPCENCRRQSEIDDERKHMRDMRQARKELFNCLLQEKSLLNETNNDNIEEQRKTLFKSIKNSLDQVINEQYKDVCDDIIEQKDKAHINQEELLRIHFYFQEKSIEGILNQLEALIGEFMDRDSLKVQQDEIAERIQIQMKKILGLINFKKEKEISEETDTKQQLLIKAMQNRFELGIPTGKDKEIARRKREILKACSKIDKELRNLENIKVYDPEARDKLTYPIKLFVKSKVFLADFLRQKLDYHEHQASEVIKKEKQSGSDANAQLSDKKRNENIKKKIKLDSHIEFDFQDLAGVLINVDEEFSSIKGNKRKVETLFDFYHKKSSKLAVQYRNAVQSVQAKNRIDEINKKEPNQEVKGVGCMTMHDITFNSFDDAKKGEEWFEEYKTETFVINSKDKTIQCSFIKDDQNKLEDYMKENKRQDLEKFEVTLYKFKDNICEDCKDWELEQEMDDEYAQKAEEFNDMIADAIDNDLGSSSDGIEKKVSSSDTSQKLKYLSPYDFSFSCDKHQNKRDDDTISRYCGQCGIDRVKQKYENKNPKYLELDEDIYCYQFLSMMNNYQLKEKDYHPGQSNSLCSLPEQTDLFFKAQMIFVIQMSIIGILIKQNLIDQAGGEYQEAYPTLIFIQMLTSYLFHIQTLNGAKFSYQRAQFLDRYPERFNERYLRAARIVCYEQFILNIVCELLNLGLLCQQDGFQDLILNYVAYAGILEIDNVYMKTQKAKYKSLGEIIEAPDQSNYLQLFKDRRFQHSHRASKVGSAFLGLGRFIYKWIYFYLLPMLVVPVGIFGWQGNNLNKDWRDDDDVYVWNSWLPQKDYPKVNFELGQELQGGTVKNVFYDDFMILFILIMFTVFTLFTYLIIKVGDIDESWIQLKQQKYKVALYICFGPFIYLTLLCLLKFTWNTIYTLHYVGYYFGWVNFFKVNEDFVRDDNDNAIKDSAPLAKANIYLIISLVYHFKQAKETGIKNIIELFTFIFNVFMMPVIAYFVFKIFLYELTLEPYIKLWDGLTNEPYTKVDKDDSQYTCKKYPDSNQWVFNPDNLDEGELDCHMYSYMICMQFYFVIGWHLGKSYIFDGVLRDVISNMGFNLERAYKNDDDFNQLLPKNKIEGQIYMGMNFFRKYPKNIVDAAISTNTLKIGSDGSAEDQKTYQERIKKLRKLFGQYSSNQEEDSDDDKQDKRQKNKELKYNEWLESLELDSVASSAARKLVNLQKYISSKTQSEEDVNTDKDLKEILSDNKKIEDTLKEKYVMIKFNDLESTFISTISNKIKAIQKEDHEKEELRKLEAHVIDDCQLISDGTSGAKGQFILDLLVNSGKNPKYEKVRESMFNKETIKIGIAVNENTNQVIMLFIKDDEFVDHRPAEVYKIEQDMPFFVVFVINFLTLVISIVCSNVGYYLLNYFLFDLVIVNAAQFLYWAFNQIYEFQFIRAKWGRFENIALYVECYTLLLFIGYIFVFIFKYQFFKKVSNKKQLN